MNDRPHILICGERGVGKSTLIERLLQTEQRPLCGFITKKLAADATGFHPIYIHRAGPAERHWAEDNLVGTCDTRVHNVRGDIFDTLGVQYLAAAPGSLIVMDELGFMESGSPRFCQAVMAALDGDIPVLAAVKSRFDVEFLNTVRAHPKAQLYMIDEQNREQLYAELSPQFGG